MKHFPRSPEDLLRTLPESNDPPGKPPASRAAPLWLDDTKGVGFFTSSGERLYTNHTLSRLLVGLGGRRLLVELEHFAGSLASLVALRGLWNPATAEELEVRTVFMHNTFYRLQGSCMGHGVLGHESVIVIVLAPVVPQESATSSSQCCPPPEA